MSPVAAAIAEDLRAAFPARRAACFVPMVNSRQGDEPARVAEEFADKEDWTALAPEWLDDAPDGLGSALSFLGDAAIRFYIPAYIAADLAERLVHVDPTFVLTHGFADFSRGVAAGPRAGPTWTDLARARWDALTPQQVTVIVRYLAWRAERDGPEIAYDIEEALAAYWHPRAAGRAPLV